MPSTAMAMRRQAANPPLPPPPPISHTPQQPVDPDAGYRFWRSLSSPRYVVAPLVNQSDLPFRLLCRRFGAQLTYTPMLHSIVFASSSKYRADHFHTSPLDRPLIAQFCGDDPIALLQAARMVEADVDAIDLNLGCPQGIARRGHYGAFLLSELPLLRSIVSTLHDHLTVPITCKIRLLPTLSATLELARTLQDAGCYALTVHGRTKENIKDNVGASDWDAIAAVKRALRIPVIANGGVSCHADVQRCLEQTGVDAVMSAEGILTFPYIFSPSASVSPPSPFVLAREYLTLCRENRHPPAVIRPHLFKLLFEALSVHVDLRQRLSSCTRDELEGVVDELERLDGQLQGEERRKRYEGKVSWYDRYQTYKGQLSAAAKKAEEKKRAAEDVGREDRKRGRDAEVEERKEGNSEGGADAEKRRREVGDAETLITESLIDAEQKQQDVDNGGVPAGLQHLAAEELRGGGLPDGEDECWGGLCRAAPTTAMLDTLEGAPPS